MTTLLRDRIRALRGNERQADFAARYGVDQATVSRWERGARPEAPILAKMADDLGVPLALFDRPDPPRHAAARGIGVVPEPPQPQEPETSAPGEVPSQAGPESNWLNIRNKLGHAAPPKMSDKDALSLALKSVLASHKVNPDTSADGLAAMAWMVFCTLTLRDPNA